MRQNGRFKIKNSRSLNQLNRDKLHSELATILADNEKPRDPDLSPGVASTPTEIQLLDHLVARKSRHTETKNLEIYVIKIAMLGGYLARNNDPTPGNLVIWRGLNRLADIALGIDIKEKLVGN